MENDRTRTTRDDVIETEGTNTVPARSASPPPLDPNDEVPVPIAMNPAEIDERAQVVEALREESNENRADDVGLSP